MVLLICIGSRGHWAGPAPSRAEDPPGHFFPVPDELLNRHVDLAEAREQAFQVPL
jgi:hypothetical protein